MASIKADGIQVAGDYQRPEVDRRALATRHEEEGYLERMSLTYRHGVDGWLEDCTVLTQPWGFELPELTIPASVWYGTADVLGPAATTSTPQRPCPGRPGPRGNLRLADGSVSLAGRIRVTPQAAGPDTSSQRDQAAAGSPPSSPVGQPEPQSAERLAYSIAEAARLTGLWRDLLYD